MNKLLLLPLLFIAATTDVFAMNLKEAFNALANIPYVSLKVNDPPEVCSIGMKIDSVGPFKIATANRLDREQILETGNAAYAILNQVPLKFMINGANNQEVAFFLYATPTGSGKYDFLAAVLSGYEGDVIFIFMTIDEPTRNAFQNAKLIMQGNSLTVIPEKYPENSAFNILINASR